MWPVGETILAVAWSPFRADSGGGIIQGKPKAKLSWLLRAVYSALGETVTSEAGTL
jgi:hypothetical protein